MPEITELSPIEDREAERCAFGAALLEVEAADLLFDSLSPQDFCWFPHRTIFIVLRQLRQGTRPPLDLAPASHELQRRPGWPEDMQADFYLGSCIEAAVTPLAPEYCRRIKQASQRRRLHRDCLEAARLAEQEDGLEAAQEMLRQALVRAEPLPKIPAANLT